MYVSGDAGLLPKSWPRRAVFVLSLAEDEAGAGVVEGEIDEPS